MADGCWGGGDGCCGLVVGHCGCGIVVGVLVVVV